MANGEGGTKPATSSQLLIWAAIQLVLIGIAWGTLKQQGEETSRRVEQIEQRQFVPEGEYDTWRNEVTERLGRIEAEILNVYRAERQKE